MLCEICGQAFTPGCECCEADQRLAEILVERPITMQDLEPVSPQKAPIDFGTVIIDDVLTEAPPVLGEVDDTGMVAWYESPESMN